MIIDSHAHLDMIKDLDSLIENAKTNRVKTIITNSINLDSSKKNLEISKRYSKFVKLAAGLYPEEDLTLEKYNAFENWVKENEDKIVAIGEIGLDKTEKLDFKLQKEIFKKQLDLAVELKVPAIIHSRKAEKEIIEILENHKDLRVILHCFHGNFKLVKKANELGFYFSIPTNIVRSEQFQKMVKELPKDKILTETDSPYLSPFKEKDNEPAFITESIKKISEIWEMDKEETERQIERNFEKLF